MAPQPARPLARPPARSTRPTSQSDPNGRRQRVTAATPGRPPAPPLSPSPYPPPHSATLLPPPAATRAGMHAPAARLSPATAAQRGHPPPVGPPTARGGGATPTRAATRGAAAGIDQARARAAVAVQRHGRGWGVRAASGGTSLTARASLATAAAAAAAAAVAVTGATHSHGGKGGNGGGDAIAKCRRRRHHRRVTPPPLPPRAVGAAVATARRDVTTRWHYVSLATGTHPSSRSWEQPLQQPLPRPQRPWGQYHRPPPHRPPPTVVFGRAGGRGRHQTLRSPPFPPPHSTDSHRRCRGRLRQRR